MTRLLINSFIVAIFCTFSFCSVAQVQRSGENTTKEEIQGLTLSLKDIEGQNTLFVNFRNADYSTIIDVGGFFLTDTTEVSEFSASLREMALEPKNSELVLRTDKWRMSVGLKTIYIWDADNKYIRIAQKQANNVADKFDEFKAKM